LLSRGKQALAGVFLALVITKPHVGLLFVLVPLVRREWRCLLTAAGTGLVATLLVSLYLGELPHELLIQVFGARAYFESGGLLLGLPALLPMLGFEFDPALPGMIFLGSLAALLCHRWREAPLLVLVSIPTVIGHVWTYSRRYDQNSLFPCLIALGLLALARGRRSDWLAFGLMGASLWIPTTSEIWDIPAIPLLQFTTWLMGLGYLLKHEAPCGQRRLYCWGPNDADQVSSSNSSTISSSSSMSFATAGRAAICSNQRFTFGKSSRS
jgi:hypothetical protein